MKQYREAVPLTQEEVATALGVSNGAISQWETGRTAPTRARAVRLDTLLKAGGVVAAAFGYAMYDITDTDRLALIESRLDFLQEQIAQLRDDEEDPPSPGSSD